MKELIKKWQEYSKMVEKDNDKMIQEYLKSNSFFSHSPIPPLEDRTMEGFMDWLASTPKGDKNKNIKKQT
ncbi:MAG: hypothetical protein GY861_18555 [bacterium]|nr:hypothetical protein [bacterium]